MSDEGLELLKAIVEKGPMRDGAPMPYCFYCECWREEVGHEPDCLWVRARAYLRDQGVEVKDDE